jgi:hypothetical protein
MPNPAHLEELLVGHEHALATIQGNLVELESEPVFAMLQVTTFSGRTREQTQRALTGISSVWKLLPVYQTAVKGARALCDEIGPFRQGKVDDLEDALTDAHIEISDEPVNVLARRLDQPAQQHRKVTIANLQAEMTGLYAEAVISIGELDRAWSTTVPKAAKLLEQSEITLALSNDLRVQNDSEVLLLAEQRRNLAEIVACDPIEAATKSDDLENLLARVNRRLKPVQERRDSVGERLQAGANRLDALRQTVTRGAELATQASAEISNHPLRSPIDSAGLDQSPNGLAPWLHSLEAAFAGGDWVSSAAGLDRWEALCCEWETTAEHVVVSNQTLFDRRNEMRGLLAASRAKALHRGRIEQQELMVMANDADEELRRVPCDLQRSQQLVQAYLLALRSGFSHPAQEANQQ